MKKSLILKNMIIVTISLIVFFICSIFILNDVSFKQEKGNILRLSIIYSEQLKKEKIADFKIPNNIKNDTRVTIVSLDGGVLFDSLKTETTENHKDRAEIIAALENKPKYVVRISNTSGSKTLYYAVKAKTLDGEVLLRIAIPYQVVNNYMSYVIPFYILIIIISIVCTYIFTDRFSKKVLDPVNEINMQISKINSGNYQKLNATTFLDMKETVHELNSVSENLSNAISGLNNEKDKLKFILNNIFEAIIVYNFSNDIVFINKLAQSLFEVTLNAVGKNIKILSVDDDFIKDISYSEENKKFEYVINDRQYFCKSQKFESVSDKLKILIMNDVTDERNQEKLRSNFFANASHELKTPITSIRGFSELLLLDEEINERQKQYTTKINNESIRLVGLIEDMLTLSKLENKVVTTEKENLNLSSVVKEVIANFESQAILKGIKINVTGDAEIFYDRSQLVEILNNLVENAIKYNNKGGEVNINIFSEEKICITVSDTGIGIEEKHLSHIFERFYRVDKARSKKTGGTGLGLSIVKHIVKLNNGEVTVESKMHEGTTFKIEF